MKNMLNLESFNILPIAFFFFLVSAVGTFSEPVQAEMEASAYLKLTDYIAYMKTSETKSALTEDQVDLIYLSKFSFHTIGLKTVLIPGSSPGPVDRLSKRLQVVDIVNAFESKLFAPEVWSVKLSKRDLQKISRDQSRLKKLFLSSEYSWAWFLVQLGKPQKSRTLLNALFDKEYERVMALKKAVYGLGGTPLGNSEKILGALNSISDEKKQGVFNEKMRKMKTHVSKLPESHIVT